MLSRLKLFLRTTPGVCDVYFVLYKLYLILRTGNLRNALAHWLYMFKRRKKLRRLRQEEEAFDALHNVDTSGIVETYRFNISNENLRFSKEYRASSPAALIEKLDAMGFAYERFTFIDIGCGKGKPGLWMTRRPFRKIVGVEFNPDLVAVARTNLTTMKNFDQRCRDVEILCQDATTYPFPETDLLVYFYRPFLANVLEKVLANLFESVRRNGNTAYICYLPATPVAEQLQTPWLEPIHRDEGYLLFRVTVPAP